MRQINRTVMLMLSHSWVTLIAVGMFCCLYLFVSFLSIYGQVPTDKQFEAILMMNIVMALFWGIYIGGAFQSLKKNYLWKINRGFRLTLFKAYMTIIGGVVIVLMSLSYFQLGNHSMMFLFVPLCGCIYASQLVLEPSWLLRFTLPALPLGLFQLKRIDFLETHMNSLANLDAILMAVILVGAIVLMIRMISPEYYRQQATTDMLYTPQSEMTSLKPSLINKFNFQLSKLIAKLIISPKGNVGWAISLPHSRLALFSLTYVLMIVIFLKITGDKKGELLEAFSVMFMASALMASIIESRHLFTQLKPFAHLMSDNKHCLLKNRVLFGTDKVFLTIALVYSIAIMLLNFSIGSVVNYVTLVGGIIIVLLVTLVFHPLLLTVRWLNVSFAQVGLASLYAFSLFFALTWANKNQHILEAPLSILIVITSIVLARLITQKIFQQIPIESLLKNK